MKNQTSAHNSSLWIKIAALAAVVVATFIAVWIMTPPEPNRKTVPEDTADFMETALGDTLTASALRALAAAREMPDSVAYDSIYKIGRDLHLRGKDLAALEYARHVVEVIQDLDKSTAHDSRLEGECLLIVGVAAERLGLMRVGLDYSARGVAIAEEIGYKKLKSNLYNNIGVLLSNNGEYESASGYYRRSLSLNQTIGNKKGMLINHNNLAEAALETGEYAEALDELLKAMQLTEAEEDSTMYYYLQSCLGLVYARRNEFAMAKSYLDNAIRNLSHSDRDDYKMAAYLSKAALHFNASNPDSVGAYLASARECAVKSGNTQLLIDCLKERQKMMASYGNWEEAYKSQSEVDQIKDSLYTEENKERFRQISRLHDLGFKGVKNADWLSWLDPVKLSWAFGAGFTLLLAGIAVLLIQRRRRVKMIEELSSTNETLQTSMNESLAKERKEKMEISEQLDINNRRLSTLTLDKIQHANVLESLDKTLRLLHTSISPKDKDAKRMAADAISMTGQLQSDGNRWDEFEMYFEKVHPSFYKNLSSRHPDLTVKERHLCALLALDLSTKDIASITFREIRSVESSRLRLRKKLGLDSEANLNDYVRSFLFAACSCSCKCE